MLIKLGLKRIIALLFAILTLPNFSYASGIEDAINSVFEPIVESLNQVIFFRPFEKYYVSMPFVVIWLIFGAIFFTIYFRFINIRLFKHAIDLVRGDKSTKSSEGEISPFQAMVSSLSGMIGLGNIAGVAVAVSIGGAGATFWMIVAGLLGMTTKFLECTLGVKYRIIDHEGQVSGGPMYYLRDGLKLRNQATLGKVLAIVFSILCVGGALGGGNMFQANQCYSQVKNVMPFLDGFGFWFGCFLAFLVGLVTLGGIKKLAHVADKLVPIMVGLYLITGVVIIAFNYSNIGVALSRIFESAWSYNALFGGAAGSITVGFQRAAFSNEAGIGTSSIAHATSKTDSPISEGIVSLLEPFIDTVIICTMTALIIVFTNVDTLYPKLEGVQLTSKAFETVFPWFPYLLTISILLFAYSTIISYSYYGTKAWGYLFGHSKTSIIIFQILFLVCVVLGSSANIGPVLNFSDIMLLTMSIPNMIGLYFMAGEVKQDLFSYLHNFKNKKI